MASKNIKFLHPPGSKLKRYFKSAVIQMKVIKGYRFGLDLARGIYLLCPQVNLASSRKGHVCVITGANRGLGLEVLKLLLQLNYTVILGVRNLEAVRLQLENICKSGINTTNVEVLSLDLKSLDSVSQFAEQILHKYDKIHMLINNAAMYQEKYEITENAVESHFQVNYLSHFLLTHSLLPRIKETASLDLKISCYIINVSSKIQEVPKLNVQNLTERKVFVPPQCYADTKLCQILHTKSLHKMLSHHGFSNIHTYAVHPGEIPTDLWKGYGKIELLIHSLAEMVCRTNVEAANVILYPALSPDLTTVCGGEYFDRGKVIKANLQSECPETRQKLWDLSIRLIRKYTTCVSQS